MKNYQNWWETVKSVLIGNFITLNEYIQKGKKKKRPKISQLDLQLRKLEKKTKLNTNYSE